ncbi:putative phage baseplate assembly protein [Kitasatospora sp. MAP12-15]|uniref:putative baseplate assembly protein n=1 Tax=unclassified Kitasatospora TaxID=2633591 RepID=UPI002473F10C|nr:putative baseplate assembly protein [Kitasatospora sp. MAP12-44]MDH6113647.1 putative phage baseplate assembly protein [Kitasatospora sp. MAP12-44]
MALPAPNLDDRRFQQLVDEAKRFVQQRCPEWSDHNVSDPGVTLIEAFAHMTDQLLYRLNRVPEKNYLAFLDLIGVKLFPASAARTGVTFWLSSPQATELRLREGTEVATAGAGQKDRVVFATTSELAIVPCEFTALLTQSAGGRPADRTEELLDGQAVPCFAEAPQVGDLMMVALSAPVPSCAVLLSLESEVEGVGVDPRQPPLVWEAFDGDHWLPCEVDTDGTGGLNRPGDVVLHVPAGHAVATVAGRRAGWLRCRTVASRPGQPFYSASPTVRSVVAGTVGGTVQALHGETVNDEWIGDSTGTPGQRFLVSRPPVLADGDPLVVEVAEGDGWQEWQEVDAFGDSGPEDRHITLDRTSGEVSFGPSVREADGSLSSYGAVPGKGARIRVRRYRTGGGRRGNVARGALTVLRSSVPYVSRVENREGAAGGVDGESVESAMLRGPVELRTQDRAVTAADYELLARRAAPSAARIRALAAGSGAAEGGVRVLVVPGVTADAGDRLRFEQMVPSDELLAGISTYLDDRRPIGARLVVEPPFYQGVTVVARVMARRGVPVGRVREQALDALYRYLNPLVGGPDGQGWPFGRPVQSGEAYAVLQRLPGVELVDHVQLFPANPLTGERGDPSDRVDLDHNALVFSHQHQVRVEEL